MSRQCEICGKKPLKASKLSFSHKHNVYRQVPNLQNIKVDVNGKVVKMKVCTSCIKANKVKTAL